MKTVRFTKMEGAGNDYIYVNTLEQTVSDPVKAAILWSDRHKGVGGDGLVLIGPSPVEEADYSMRIFNADGSEAMMCGNASRCIAKYLYERKITDKTTIRLYTLSGIKLLKLNLKGKEVESVTVDMGMPEFSEPDQFIPSDDPGMGTFVSMGNPHYVVFTDNVNFVEEEGKVLENHHAFPQRCNIEFAKIKPGCGIRVRVWERGSGITQACGTGACATAVAAIRQGLSKRKVAIIMDGGTLQIEWRESDNHVYMTGPAQFVFDGEVKVPTR